MPLLGRRVLVVDDDEDTVELERFVLAKARAEVRAVRSVREAMAVVESFIPDVVIADLMMPEEDGFTLVQDLRRRGLHPTSLALTGRAEASIAERAREAGFATTMTKPIDPQDLVRTIVRAIA
jgi:CheY-like chemotaxis protein